MATDDRMTGRRDDTMKWVLGAVALIALLGVIFWSTADNNSPTVRNNTDTNTGSVSRTAPAPGDPQAPLPGNPARP
jgi:hypothetical protein